VVAGGRAGDMAKVIFQVEFRVFYPQRVVDTQGGRCKLPAEERQEVNSIFKITTP
jgi:hypothetical protein